MAAAHGHIAWSFTDGTNIVQLSDIRADETTFEPPRDDGSGPVDPFGNSGRGTKTASLSLATASLTGQSQIETWERDKTKIQAAGYGPAYGYQWYEEDALNVGQPLDIEGQVQGRPGMRLEMMHTENSPTIYRQVNLLAHLAAAAGSSYDETIVFPVEGAPLTLAATVSGTANITLTAEDTGASQVGQSTDSFTDERGSVSLALPSGTYQVQCEVSGGTGVSDVSLRVDGGTIYTSY